MKTQIEKNKYMLLSVLLFLCTDIYAAAGLSALEKEADLIALCYPAGTVQASVLEQLEGRKEAGQAETPEKNSFISEIALWRSSGEPQICAEQTGRRKKVSCYQIKGQAGAVFGRELIHGRYFLEKENNVCLLDKDTARQLYGSDEVLGMEVRIHETDCQIVGVLDAERSVCVIPANDTEDSDSTAAFGEHTSRRGTAPNSSPSASGGRGTVQDNSPSVSGGRGTAQDNSLSGFDGIAVRKRNKEQSSAAAVSYLETMFGSTDSRKIDGRLYYITACFLHVSVLAAILVLSGIASGKHRQRKWPLWSGLAAASGVLILGIRSAPPGSDYLPTYWSDFEFFSRMFQEKAEQIQSLAAHQEFSSWQNILWTWQQVTAAEILAVFFFMAAYLSAANPKDPAR